MITWSSQRMSWPGALLESGLDVKPRRSDCIVIISHYHYSVILNKLNRQFEVSRTKVTVTHDLPIAFHWGEMITLHYYGYYSTLESFLV